MSWFSKQLKSAGKMFTHPASWAQNAGKTVGTVAQKAAPIVGMVPGVGAVGAGLLGAAGSVLAGGNMESHLKSGVSGALGGLLGGGGVGGVGGLVNAVKDPKMIAKALGSKFGIPGISAAAGAARPGGGGGAPTPGDPNARIPDFQPVNWPGLPNPGGGGGGGSSGLPPIFGLPGTTSAPGSMPGASASGGGGGWMQNIGNAASGVFDWMKENPELVATGAQAVGGYLDGKNQSQMHESGLAENKRQFDAQLGVTAGRDANALNRQLETNPVRDQLLHLLSQRVGMSPQQFQPQDIYAPGGASAPSGVMSGIQPQMQAAQGAYTPGAGGTNPAIAQALMARLMGTAGAPMPAGGAPAGGLPRKEITSPGMPPNKGMPISATPITKDRVARLLAMRGA